MSENDIYVIIGKTLHSFGLFASSIVILTLIAFSIANLSLINRLTIRILIPLILADFIVHLSELIGLGSNKLLGTFECELIAGLRYFGRLLYSLTNIGMCFNLYRCIVLLGKPNIKLEILIWVVMVFILIIMMIVFGYLGSFSGLINKSSCRPGSDIRLYFQIEEGLVGVLSLIALIVCLSVYLISRKQFNRSISTYAQFNIRDASEKEKFIKKRRKMLERSFLYPLATIITLPGTIALSIMDLINNYSPYIFIILSLTQGSSGILTSIAFFLDPAVIKGFNYLKLKFVIKECNNVNN